MNKELKPVYKSKTGFNLKNLFYNNTLHLFLIYVNELRDINVVLKMKYLTQNYIKYNHKICTLLTTRYMYMFIPNVEGY